MILLLILAAFIFVETPFGQNWLAAQVTKKFSKELNTKISFKHVSFSLLNRLNLEGFLLEDQQHDTLLYAGNLQVRITDWFIFKKKAELKYVGLQNSVIKLQKNDTSWNYQFLVDYFSPATPSTPNREPGLQFSLKNLELSNVVFIQRDRSIGQDITAAVGRLQLEANEITADKKNIDIVSLDISHPFVVLYNYHANENPSNKTTLPTPSDSLPQWNPDNWKMNIASLRIDDGVFKNIKETNEPALTWFDPNNIEFSKITGQFNNVRLSNDTISARLNDLATQERSGIVVKSLNSDIRMTPNGMFFTNLNLQTNNSRIRNYFSMSYADMDDLNDFVRKVKLQADLEDSQVDTDDLGFFAPEIRNWQKHIDIRGRVRGTIADISGKGLVVSAGKNTYINGDITLSGLPDIDRTFIDFRSNDSKTNYADILRFAPSVSHVTQPDLASLGNIHFTGSFTGFIHDFVTFGTITTNLGTVTTDLNMKLRPGTEAVYSGNIGTTGFQLGKFLQNSQLGLLSFSGIVKGHGTTANTLGVDLNADISEVDFNGYRYHNITANGTLEKQLFNGYASVNDSNLQADLNGLININGPDSKFDLVADVKAANLEPLNFTEDSVYFNGKFNLDFTGNNIDNFLGVARISHANLVRNDQRLAFDSLVLHSDYAEGTRTLTVNSNEFDGSITGDFHIADLPNAIQLFLNKYYPSYIMPPSHVITHQNFRFSLVTRQADPFIEVIDNEIKGFNDSKIDGSLDLAQNQLQLTAQVPEFSFDDQYSFDNTKIQASGTFTNLSVNGSIQNITINDSLNLPNTSFTINARNDSSRIRISTAANQAVTKADLNASIITYNDGVKIDFDTSAFVLNTKMWTIDKGGALSFRKHISTKGDVVLHETNQEIRLRTIPSDKGNWNDLLIDLKNVNIGDISPYVVSPDRLEGLISGSGKIENPGPRMVATGDFKTEFFRFNEDSIGELSIGKISYDNGNDGNLRLLVTNPDSTHMINASVNVFLKGDHDDNLISMDTKEYQLKFLDNFLGNIFSDIEGYATGRLDIKGNLNSLDYIGKAHLHNAGVKLNFTRVFYRLRDTDIELKSHELNLGSIKLIDTLTNGTATVSGSIYHDSWKNLNFDLSAKVDSKPITLLNTSAQDNTSFYGHALGTGSMILVGSENDLYMTVDAKSSEKDSSSIIIPPAKSRASEMADFLVERTHGYSINDSIAVARNNKMTFDIDLTADPHTTIEVILDEVTGDMVKGRGQGSLNIHSATDEPLTLNGNLDIEEGNYLFTFQSFFKRPFVLRKGTNNYIKWNGDPSDATIHFDAQYTAKDVSFAPLASSLDLGTNVQTTREDVNVIVTMSGKLLQPKFDFALEFPPGSVTISDPVLAFNINQIQNNINELNKQVTYLIVFNSFAPLDNLSGSNATAATASGGITGAINELAYNTISSLLFNELNKEFSTILSQIFKDDKLKVIISGSVYNRNLVQQNTSNNFSINTGNVNVTLSRAVFNDRFIITAGSTLDIPLQTELDQKFQFLPDVNMEWLINQSGSIRATFFYKQNLEFLPGVNISSTAVNKKIGSSIAYRREFDHLREIFKRTRNKKRQSRISNPETELNPSDSTNESGGSHRN